MGSVVREFKPLSRNGSDKALRLLQRIASQVKPIMVKRGWSVGQLCEFYPSNSNLLGSNINRGQKINLRLRPAGNDTQFLEYDDLLGTMLHELAHIERGPHDATFYKLLDGLNTELDDLIRTGYTGEAFFSQGHRLGSSKNGVTPQKARELAAQAALKRAQLRKIMPHRGGIRLGSGQSSSIDNNATPGEMAARAALQRQRDRLACGSQDDSSSSTPSIPQIVASSKRRIDDQPTAANPEKKAKPQPVIIDLVSDEEWTCAACTFQNPILILACTICFTEKPLTTHVQDVSWSCPRCTLHNESHSHACIACDFTKHP